MTELSFSSYEARYMDCESRQIFVAEILRFIIVEGRATYTRLGQHLLRHFTITPDDLGRELLMAYTALVKSGAIDTNTVHDGEPAVGKDTELTAAMVLGEYFIKVPR